MRYKRNISDFKKLIEAFIKLDDKLYELIMKKRFNESRDRVNFYIKSITSYDDEGKYRSQKKTITSLHQWSSMLSLKSKKEKTISREKSKEKKTRSVIRVIN